MIICNEKYHKFSKNVTFKSVYNVYHYYIIKNDYKIYILRNILLLSWRWLDEKIKACLCRLKPQSADCLTNLALSL